MDYLIDRVVIDTDVLVDFLRGKNSAITRLKELAEARNSLATTVINIFELSWGCFLFNGLRRETYKSSS
ncbi:MAG: PIN domain-containing protein [Desulfurococcaceae archaeon TW002]